MADKEKTTLFNGELTASTLVYTLADVMKLYDATRAIPQNARRAVHKALSLSGRKRLPVYAQNWLMHALFGDFAPESGSFWGAENDGQKVLVDLVMSPELQPEKCYPLIADFIAANQDNPLLTRAFLGSIEKRFTVDDLRKHGIKIDDTPMHVVGAPKVDIDAIVAAAVAAALKAHGITDAPKAAESPQKPAEKPESPKVEAIEPDKTDESAESTADELKRKIAEKRAANLQLPEKLKDQTVVMDNGDTVKRTVTGVALDAEVMTGTIKLEGQDTPVMKLASEKDWILAD